MADNGEALVEQMIEEICDHPWYRDLGSALETVRGRRAAGQSAALEDALSEMELRRTSPDSIERLRRAMGELRRIRRAVDERLTIDSDVTTERTRLMKAAPAELMAAQKDAVEEYTGAAMLGAMSSLERFRAETLRRRSEMIDGVVFRRLGS